MEFATRTIHAGQPSEPETGAVVAPIFQTTTYQQIAPGEHRGFDYTRTNNPTRQRLEAVLADLEGGTHCAVFGSGLAAEHAMLQAYLKPGTEIVVPGDVYGGTFRMLHRVFEPIGCRVTQADFADLAALERCDHHEHASGVARVADQSAAARVRHRRDEPTRPREGRAGRRRQHVCDAVLSAAVLARRGSGRPQRDEVPRRALRCDSGRGDRARRGDLRAGRVSAERARRRAEPVRLLADAARPEDARAADAAARGERRGRGRRARASSARRRVSTSRACASHPATRSRGVR